MRILFLSNFFPPYELGGMELRCKETMDSLSKRGHTCHVLASRYGVSGRPGPRTMLRTLHLQSDIYHYRPLDFILRSWRREPTAMVSRVIPKLGRTLYLCGVYGTCPVPCRTWPRSGCQDAWHTYRQLLAYRAGNTRSILAQTPRRRWVKVFFAPVRWLALRALAGERKAHPWRLSTLPAL